MEININTVKSLYNAIIPESSAQFENRIKPRVYVRRITSSTMYKKAPFC